MTINGSMIRGFGGGSGATASLTAEQAADLAKIDAISPDVGNDVLNGQIVFATDNTGERWKNISGSTLPMPAAFPATGFQPVTIDESRFEDSTDGMDVELGNMITFKPGHTINIALPKDDWFIYRILDGDDHSGGNSSLDFGAGTVSPAPTANVGVYKVVSNGSDSYSLYSLSGTTTVTGGTVDYTTQGW